VLVCQPFLVLRHAYLQVWVSNMAIIYDSIAYAVRRLYDPESTFGRLLGYGRLQGYGLLPVIDAAVPNLETEDGFNLLIEGGFFLLLEG
jgi:hypothetical protein